MLLQKIRYPITVNYDVFSPLNYKQNGVKIFVIR